MVLATRIVTLMWLIQQCMLYSLDRTIRADISACVCVCARVRACACVCVRTGIAMAWLVRMVHLACARQSHCTTTWRCSGDGLQPQRYDV